VVTGESFVTSDVQLALANYTNIRSEGTDSRQLILSLLGTLTKL